MHLLQCMHGLLPWSQCVYPKQPCNIVSCESAERLLALVLRSTNLTIWGMLQGGLQVMLPKWLASHTNKTVISTPNVSSFLV